MEKKCACRLLVGNSEGKRTLGRSRRRLIDNNKIDLVEIRWGGVDWIDLTQDEDNWRDLVNTVMKIRVLSDGGELLSGYTTRGLSSCAQLRKDS
jgi:hypothetical protein